MKKLFFAALPLFFLLITFLTFAQSKEYKINNCP